ncbi:MAG: alpha/beta hydrolase [Halieaceae bacterium]
MDQLRIGRLMVERAYLKLDHGQLHYRHSGMGPGAGIPLLLLHQSPSDSRMYGKLMTELDSEFRLLAPDTPGFGSSDPLPAGVNLEVCAAAMLALLDALDIEQCHLFGHHTGAAVAVELAALAPQRIKRVALCGPPLLSPELRAALPGKAAPFPIDRDGSHLLGMWQRMAGKEAAASPQLLLREVMSAFAAGDSYAQSYQAVAAQDFESLLRGLRQPTLVFAGSEDILYPQLEPSFACLQNGYLREVDGAASYICETRPAEVAGLLREFLLDD